MHYETIHTETRDGFDIVFSVAPEHIAPGDLFDDDGEAAAAIRDGDGYWFVARIEAKKHGVTLGTDYLGGCWYRSFEEFIGDDYYAGMVDAAISQARDTLDKLAA